MHFRALVLLQDVDVADIDAVGYATAEALHFYEEEAELEPREVVCSCVNLRADNDAAASYRELYPEDGEEREGLREDWRELTREVGAAAGPEFKGVYATVDEGLGAYTRAGVAANTLTSFRTRELDLRVQDLRLSERHRRFLIDAIQASPHWGVPDPACDCCGGSGYWIVRHNPNPEISWWVIGGRYSGDLDGYEPRLDPENYEPCDCDGDCSGCKGTGQRLRHPADWAEHPGDAQRLGNLGVLGKMPSFAAIVTPDGEWHESVRSRICWIPLEEDTPEEWRARQRQIVGSYGHDVVAVVVDCNV